MAFTSLLTTELNSLAAGNGSSLGSEFDNTATGTKYMFGDFQLAVEFASSPTVNELVHIYLIPALDGSNYADGSSTFFPATCHKGAFPVRANADPQKLVLFGIVLPPSKFKMIVVNTTSAAFESSGNVLSILPYGQALS